MVLPALDTSPPAPLSTEPAAEVVWPSAPFRPSLVAITFATPLTVEPSVCVAEDTVFPTAPVAVWITVLTGLLPVGALPQDEPQPPPVEPCCGGGATVLD